MKPFSRIGYVGAYLATVEYQMVISVDLLQVLLCQVFASAASLNETHGAINATRESQWIG